MAQGCISSTICQINFKNINRSSPQSKLISLSLTKLLTKEVNILISNMNKEKNNFSLNLTSPFAVTTLIVVALLFFKPNGEAQCTLNNGSGITSGHLNSTGNSEIDNLIKSEKIKLEKFFNVKVDLKIYSGANGLAKRTCQSASCNGTIELGKELLIFEYNKTGPSSGVSIGKYMVMSIMAHEFAHIFQYSHPELKFKNAVIQEVHADMLAGWYITKYLVDNIPSSDKHLPLSVSWDKTRKIYTDLTISFGWMGDRAYWSQQHHGNYLTRAMAFKEGWKDYKERGITDFQYFLKWSIQTSESLIQKWDQD